MGRNWYVVVVWCGCLVLGVVCGLYVVQVVENGVSFQEIVLGQLVFFIGLVVEVGCDFQEGVCSYFVQVNVCGGVYGCCVCLLSLDDGYEFECILVNIQ